jgi:hypothetical protein
MLTLIQRREPPRRRFNSQAGKLPDVFWRAALLRRVLLALCVAGAVGAANAEEGEKPFPPWDRATITLGANVATLNSSVSFGINGAAGLSVTPENVLGLDSTLFVFGIGGFYRLGESKRHQINLSYAGYHRSASTTLTDQIQIGDTVLFPGTQVDTVFNFDIARVSYTYAVFQDERVRIGLGLGVYVAPVKINVKVATPDQTFEAGKLQATLPLPAIVLAGELRLTPKFSLVGDFNAMYLEINDFQGALLNTTLGIEYNLWKHFGLGMAFNIMAVNVEAKSSDNSYPGAEFVGKMNVQYGSLLLFGKFAF